jgi:hypothetical protein
MTFVHGNPDKIIVDLNEHGEFAAADMLEALIADNLRLRAQVKRIRDLADRMEAESPKPGPGGFLAETLRDELDKEN